MNTVNVIEDICTLTTISRRSLSKLVSLAESVASHAIVESCMTNEPVTCLEIGIGRIYITDSEQGILYKFVPTQDFGNIVKDAIVNKKSKVVDITEAEMRKRIEDTYKDMF